MALNLLALLKELAKKGLRSGGNTEEVPQLIKPGTQMQTLEGGPAYAPDVQGNLQIVNDPNSTLPAGVGGVGDYLNQPPPIISSGGTFNGMTSAQAAQTPLMRLFGGQIKATVPGGGQVDWSTLSDWLKNGGPFPTGK